jgi:hypothetical protein
MSTTQRLKKDGQRKDKQTRRRREREGPQTRDEAKDARKRRLGGAPRVKR